MFAHAHLQALIGAARPDDARHFYRDVLGLTLHAEDQFSLTFRFGDAELRIAKVPSVAPSPYAVAGFLVPDASAAAAALTAKGVRLERFPFLIHDADGVWTGPDGTKVAWFRDPDLNLLSLTQRP